MPAMGNVCSGSAILFALLFMPGPAHGRTLRQERKPGFQSERPGGNVADSLLAQLRLLRDRQIKAGSLDSAMRTGLELTAIVGTRDDRIAMAKDWLVLSEVSRRSGDLDGAVSSAKKGILVLKTTGNQEEVTKATFNLLDVLLQAGRMSEFKNRSDEALANCQRTADHDGAAKVLYRQGEGLIRQNRPADALTLLHLAIRESPASLEAQEAAAMRFALARAYAALAQWKPAQAAYKEGITRFPQAPRSFPALYGLEAKIHEGLGDLRSALHCEREQATTRDSAFSSVMAERMANIRMMYEVRSKEVDLEKMMETNGNLQAGLANNEKLMRWLAGIAALFAACVLVFVVLRKKEARTVRRTRMRNAVLSGHAKEMEAKSEDLEQQNLRLSHALLHDPSRLPGMVGSPVSACLHWLNFLLLTQVQQAKTPSASEALGELHRRLATLCLMEEHVAKSGDKGILNLRAHWVAMAAALIKEHGMAGRMDPEFTIAAGEVPQEAMLPMSLLVRELLMVSMAHLAAAGGKSRIMVSLRPLGEYQCELVYTDEAGGINRDSLNSGSLEAVMIHAISKAVNGAIILLKGDHTAFQLTFAPMRQGELRRAS